MARIVLIVGLVLCVAGVLGIGWQFLRRPRRRRLREARAFYRRGVQLLDLGDVAGAVAMGREGAQTWTGAGPTIAAPRLVADLARLAARLGTGLHEAGRDQDAVLHLAAAEAALRDRVDAAPARYRPALAELLTVRAAVEGRLGNHSQALRYDGLALPMLRQLAESDDPHAYALPLARGLATEARHFYEIGRLAEALACSQQAIERLRAGAGHPADLAQAVADRAAILLAAGRTQEALAASQEAVALRLGAHDPDRLRTCPALTSLGESLLRQGRAAQATAPLRDAVALARSAAATDPRRGKPCLATSLSTLAAALAADAQGIADGTVDKDIAEEALACALEAERIARTLAEAEPSAYGGLLARATCDLACAYAALGRIDDARPCADESVRLFEKAGADRGRRFEAEYERAVAVRIHLAS